LEVRGIKAKTITPQRRKYTIARGAWLPIKRIDKSSKCWERRNRFNNAPVDESTVKKQLR
jgi:hypothetical protein